MKNKNLVVGAGISGATIANLLTNNNEQVLIIDKKPHIAGACFDYKDKNNITIHKYGSHIFHTENKDIWEYVNKFAKFNSYKHKVLVELNNKQTTLPFNLNSIDILFQKNKANKFKQKLISHFGYDSRISIIDFQQSKDEDLAFLAKYVYENIYKNYTKKHWGDDTTSLDLSFLKRVPIVINNDDYYFKDKYQGIPSLGYTKLIENMLNHKNIEIKLNTSFQDLKADFSDFKRIFYTGSIDDLFDKKYGALSYRSVEFELEEHKTEYYQNNAVINFPNKEKYTRIHEYKYYLNEKSKKTIIAKEYPTEYTPQKNEPYYPIPTKENEILHAKYLASAKKIKNLYTLGRLGDYKYCNMDEAIKRAFEIFKLIY